MKVKVLALLIAASGCFCLASCKKPMERIEDEEPIPELPIGLDIESFRQHGMSDYALLQRAVDSLSENSTIRLANKTYVIDHTVIVMKSMNFVGPATLKRENQKVYRLTEQADENSRFVVVDRTAGLRVTDRLLLSNDINHNAATQINVVSRVSGDTVFLNNPLGKTVGGASVYAAGTKLLKNINFFWIVDPYEYPRQQCTFQNIKFDGNRANNANSFSWYLNAAVTALTKGPTNYEGCTFVNSPGETIMGHNAIIKNCVFENLNGSAFHTSADKAHNTEDEVKSVLTGNVFRNTNQISTTITGHSEGAITHSNSGGYYTATKNRFINVGESVLGALYPSLSQHDWGTSNIVFEENFISSEGRMVYLIDTTTPGDIRNVRIQNNEIEKLNGKDWEEELKVRTDIVIENSVNL